MKDRGMIKWQPFKSVIPNKEIINYLEHKRKRISKPILSEDEINELNNVIIDNFHSMNEITIKYFKNGYIYTLTGIITELDYTNKKIIIKNNPVYFSQIITAKSK